MEARERLRQQWEKMHGRAWIPVAERLPARGERVIVSFRGPLGGRRKVSAETFWIDGPGGWTGCDSMKDGMPTHWMPMPHPPAT
jgi:hypothetical protein